MYKFRYQIWFGHQKLCDREASVKDNEVVVGRAKGAHIHLGIERLKRLALENGVSIDMSRLEHEAGVVSRMHGVFHESRPGTFVYRHLGVNPATIIPETEGQSVLATQLHANGSVDFDPRLGFDLKLRDRRSAREEPHIWINVSDVCKETTAKRERERESSTAAGEGSVIAALRELHGKLGESSELSSLLRLGRHKDPGWFLEQVVALGISAEGADKPQAVKDLKAAIFKFHPDRLSVGAEDEEKRKRIIAVLTQLMARIQKL